MGESLFYLHIDQAPDLHVLSGQGVRKPTEIDDFVSRCAPGPLGPLIACIRQAGAAASAFHQNRLDASDQRLVFHQGDGFLGCEKLLKPAVFLVFADFILKTRCGCDIAILRENRR